MFRNAAPCKEVIPRALDKITKTSEFNTLDRKTMVFHFYTETDQQIKTHSLSLLAAMLSLWCEDLGRLLLLRHQKNRTPEQQKGGSGNNMNNMQMQQPPMQKSMTPGLPG